MNSYITLGFFFFFLALVNGIILFLGCFQRWSEAGALELEDQIKKKKLERAGVKI